VVYERFIMLIALGWRSVDVLDPYGTLLLRVVTNFIVNNFQFAGPGYRQLWIVGQGGVSVVDWELQGMAME